MQTMEITFCCGLPEDDAQARELLGFLRRVGATSLQSYIQWKLIEPHRGEFAWEFYDRELRLIQEFGLKWVPFVILGPWYIAPAWFQNSPDSHVARCLEHHRESRVQSIWNPAMPVHVERVLKAFADRYLSSGALESILLGITGDYGEAIYPAVGNWPTDYHTHRGYWCADDHAVADFQQELRNQFGTLESLNRRWNTHYSSWEIAPFTHENAPSKRAWLDQMRWYRGAMIRWADTWFTIAKSSFPGVPLYLCTGGDGMPQHGSDFSLQCKLAARHNSGVRITNEGSDYLFNFIITRLVASASKHYGAFFGFEPASAVDENGILARVYNAAASGARQLHEYVHNFYQNGQLKQETVRRFEANQSHLDGSGGTPHVEVAVLLPLSDFTCQEVGFTPRLIAGARWLRDITDFDFVDENLIVDGALRHYRYLIVLDGSMIDADALKAIEMWVRQGGVFVTWQMLKTIEGDDTISRHIFGLTWEGEELTGIQGVRLVERELLDHFGKVPRPITAHSFRGFEATVRPAVVLEKDQASVVWLNRLDEGYGIFYAGPIELDEDLSFTWMGEQHMYLHLIRDCLFNLSRIDEQWIDLPRLDDELDQVYVTELEDRLLYLNFSDRPIQKQTPQGIVDIPAYSICAIKPKR